MQVINKFKFGFTLAEVLITLGIIGIVAALTMPSVIQKHHEKVTVTKVKKFYSIANQGFLYAKQEFGLPEEWGITGRDAGSNNSKDETYVASNAVLIRNNLFKNVKRLNDCDNAKKQSACGFANDYYELNGHKNPEIMGNSAKTASTLLADGSSILVIANPTAQSRGSGVLNETYGMIYYDINGPKLPNMYGKDLFTFYLTNQNIMPAGTQYETAWSFSTCSTYGQGCTAWLLINENMDYLKCPNKLGWNKASSCKN